MKKFINFNALVLTLLIMAGISEASDDNVKSQLQLIATIDGEPVFKPATWFIKCRNDVQGYEVKVNRHTAVVDLEPGKCSIRVTLGGKSRKRDINIEEKQQYSLVVSLD